MPGTTTPGQGYLGIYYTTIPAVSASLGLEWEICTYLDSAAFGAVFGSNLFATQMPDQPDTALAVIARGGLRPVMTLTGGGLPESKFDRPNVQIRGRSDALAFADGNDLMQATFAALQGIVETTLRSGGPLFHLIYALQSPQYLGRDEKERHQWSQNLNVWWENPQR